MAKKLKILSDEQINFIRNIDKNLINWYNISSYYQLSENFVSEFKKDLKCNMAGNISLAKIKRRFYSKI
jgi:hypothetical protein